MNEEEIMNPNMTEVTEVIVVKEESSSGFSNLKLSNVGYGLLSVILFVGVAAALSKIAVLPSFTYGMPQMLGIVFNLTIYLSFLLAAFGPAVYVGSRKGLKTALAIIACEFLWLVILFSTYYITNPNPVAPTMGGFGF